MNMLDGFGYGSAGRWRGLFCSVDCKSGSPEAVVVCPIRVVEQDLTSFTEFVAFYVEFVEEVDVEGYVKVI